MHLAVDEHERQVHIVAGECLFGDRTLGLGEQRVQFAFEVFEIRPSSTIRTSSPGWRRAVGGLCAQSRHRGE